MSIYINYLFIILEDKIKCIEQEVNENEWSILKFLSQETYA
jgi:hypothetical protein